MSESLVLDAYQARQQKELDDFLKSTPQTAPTSPVAEPAAGAQPQQPQEVAQAQPGVIADAAQPWVSAGKQMADAIVAPAGTPGGPGGEYRGVPRRLWEFTKGAGRALVAPAETLGNLVGSAHAAVEDWSGTLTDQYLDQHIAQVQKDLSHGVGDAGTLMMLERFRALPYDERLKLTHDAASFAISNVAAASGVALPIPGMGLVASGLGKAARWVRSGATAAEEATPLAAGAGEAMATKLGTASAKSALNVDQVVAASGESGNIGELGEKTPAAQALDQVRRNESTVDEGREFMARNGHGSPNTSRMAVSDAAKAMIENINSQMEEAGTLTRAATQTNDATIQASASSPYRKVETILSHPDYAPLAAHDLTAARDTRDALLTHAETLVDRVLAGDTAAAAEMRAAILTTGQVSAKVTNAETAVARALQSGNIVSDASRSRGLDFSRWSKSIEALSADLPATDAELATAFRATQDAEKATQIAEWTAKRPSAFWDIYYGLNMLSSPATHVAKTTGEVVAQVTGMADRTVGALVMKPFRWLGIRQGAGLTLGETPAYVGGALDHIGEAFTFARNAYRGGRVVVRDGQLVSEIGAQGEGYLAEMERVYGDGKNVVPPSEPVEAAQDGGLMAKFYDVAATKSIGGLAQSMGQVVKNTMGGVADFWRTLTFHGEIAALAERIGAEKGLSAADVELLKAHPTEDMLMGAESAMKERTFSKEFSSTVGQAAQTVASSPVMRLTVTPFWRTPVRLAEFGMDHTPILNEIASAVRGDFQAGGVRMEMAIGRCASSWAFTAGMYKLAASGVLTGAGPSDPVLKRHMEDTGWQPFSVHVGDKYISYKPLLTTLPAIGAAATLAEMAPSLKDDGYYTLLQAVALAQVRGALDHPFWQGAADAFAAIEGAGKGATEKFEDFVNKRATSALPGGALLRTVVRAQTDQIDMARTGDAEGGWAEVQALIKQFQSNIPGYAKDLPAHRNVITGEPIARGANAFGASPFVVTTKKNDAVLEEIARLKGAGLPMEPPRVLGGIRPDTGPVDTTKDMKEGVRLTEAERAKLTDYLTQSRVIDGKTLHDKLEQIINSPSYQKLSEGHDNIAGPDGSKALEIQKIFGAYLKYAEEKTKQDFPELGQAVLSRQMARKQALIPQSTAQ
jgi:hypothetical protein